MPKPRRNHQNQKKRQRDEQNNHYKFRAHGRWSNSKCAASSAACLVSWFETAQGVKVCPANSQRRRRDIFVVSQNRNNSAPSGRHISLLTELEKLESAGGYKYVAPPVLENKKRADVYRRVWNFNLSLVTSSPTNEISILPRSSSPRSRRLSGNRRACSGISDSRRVPRHRSR